MLAATTERFTKNPPEEARPAAGGLNEKVSKGLVHLPGGKGPG